MAEPTPQIRPADNSKALTLGAFRKLTAGMPDDVQIATVDSDGFYPWEMADDIINAYPKGGTTRFIMMRGLHESEGYGELKEHVRMMRDYVYASMKIEKKWWQWKR